METKGYFTPQRITRIALLAAVSSVLFFQPEIPIIGFYKLDFSNLPVLLGGFSMGPLAGFLILLIKSFTGLLHSDSMGVGELADLIFGMSIMLPAVLIYQRKKNRKNALIGMAVGTVCLILSGVLVNAVLLIPFYTKVMGFTNEAILGMFPPVINSIEKMLFIATAPFNLLKGVALSVLTYILYSHLSPFLHGRNVR
jgi:riboflavin transporter FmnP